MSDRASGSHLVLLTGLSGAGKRSILHVLEDLGFEAIDNPPLPLIEELAASDPPPGPEGGGSRRLAVCVDARTRGFDPATVLATLERLRRIQRLRTDLVVAWADEAVLLRRFTETRRRHPLSPHGNVVEGISLERALLERLYDAADLRVDTSGLPLPELRHRIERAFGTRAATEGPAALSVALVSFAFPAGLPRDADMVFDVRFLANPHYVTGLKPLTGYDPAVGAYVEADPDFAVFYGHLTALLALLLPRFVREGKKYATVAIGCTGGRHRSVYIVERLLAELGKADWRVTAFHRELSRSGMPPTRTNEAAPAGGATNTVSGRPPQEQRSTSVYAHAREG